MKSTSYVILIHGLVNGEPSAYDEMYLTRFDFVGCELGECNLLAAQNVAHALHFPSVTAASEFWKQIDPRQPTRPDGKPNRPLTAFSVTLEPAAAPASDRAASPQAPRLIS